MRSLCRIYLSSSSNSGCSSSSIVNKASKPAVEPPTTPNASCCNPPKYSSSLMIPAIASTSDAPKKTVGQTESRRGRRRNERLTRKEQQVSSSSFLSSFHDRQTLDLLEQANSSLFGGRKIGRERSLESESSGESREVEKDVSDLFRRRRKDKVSETRRGSKRRKETHQLSPLSIDGSNEVPLNDLKEKRHRWVSSSSVETRRKKGVEVNSRRPIRLD